MSDQPEEIESIRWRPWPCSRCSGGLTAFGYLRRCHRAGEEISEGTRNEVADRLVEREKRWLCDWVSSCPHQEEIEFRIPKIAEGSEHCVYFEADKSSVIKVTRPMTFGAIYFLNNGLINELISTPAQYFMRLHWWERLFGFAPDALGVTSEGRIVSRQRFATGDPPTQAEVDGFLELAGLVSVKRECFVWKEPTDDRIECWVGDTRDENFVRTADGLIPIDIRVWLMWEGREPLLFT